MDADKSAGEICGDIIMIADPTGDWWGATIAIATTPPYRLLKKMGVLSALRLVNDYSMNKWSDPSRLIP